MHTMALRRLLLLAGCVTSVHALAGVGGTSAGVTTNIPGQGTEASPDVQAQSAGFVQQNQQLQNGAAPNGVAVPATANGTNAGPRNAANAGQGNTANAPVGGDSRQKPGDPDPANAKPAVPPTPPPPPPTYVSVVKHLTPQTTDPDNTAKPVADVANAVKPAAQPALPAAAKAGDPPPAPVAAPRATVNPARASAADANVAKNAATDRTAPAVAGGRGEAPDGFAFYAGLGIAILLLAIALAAYLRTQRDEAAIRPPE